MRTIVSLMAAVAATGIVLPASAADFVAKAPVYTYNWTGCYLGGQVGGGLEHDYWAGESGENENGGGVILGGQLGCNYQTGWPIFGGAIVVGVEGEGSWSSIRNTYSYSSTYIPGLSYPVGSGYSYNEPSNNIADADIAARFGIAFNRALLYTKVGAAWGRFNFSDTYTTYGFYGSCSTSTCITTSNGSATLPGMLLGFGLEYAFLQNWTVKLEYNYIAFLQSSVSFSGVCGASGCPNGYNACVYSIDRR